MTEEAPTPSLVTPANLLGEWCGKDRIVSFHQDGSYSLLTGIGDCREQMATEGVFTLEQSVLTLRNGASTLTFQAKMAGPHQLLLTAQSTASNDQTAAIPPDEQFNRSFRRDGLIFEVRATASGLRAYLNLMETKTSLSWWDRVRNWLGDPSNDLVNPVRIKNLEKALAHLQLLLHFLAEPGHQLPAQIYHTLPELLAQLQQPQCVSFDSAWELADALEGELLHLGDDQYVRGVWYTWPSVRISKEVSGRLATAVATPGGDSVNKVIRPFLLEDQRDLSQEYRRDRAMIRMRQKYLAVMAFALVVLDIAFCAFYLWPTSSAATSESSASVTSTASQAAAAVQPTAVITASTAMTPMLPADGSPEDGTANIGQETSVQLLLLVATAGAIGSVLSRAAKLSRQPLPSESGANAGKEEPLGIRTLLSARSIFLAQIVLGATAALVVYLVFSSGLLNIAQLDKQTPATLAVLAFIAGFSEPFLTNVVDKVSGRVV